MIPAVAQLEIRPYREADRAAVKALWGDTLGHAVEIDRDLTFLARCDNARLFLGVIGGEIVATTAAGHDGNRGWLHRVATRAAHRRKGYARQLVMHAEAWLAGLELPKVNLQIRGRQPEVQAFYESLGYAVEDRTSMGKRLVPVGAPLRDKPSLSVTITHLEMRSPPRLPAPPAPALKLAVMRVEQISVAFYRYLYTTVGAPWLWWERNHLADPELASILNNPAVEVHALYAAGEPAGYVEIDHRRAPEALIAYFGLVPHFIGRRLGPWFLHWSIDAAWRRSPTVLRVNTCTLDHPKALALYQRLGFVPVRQETKRIIHPAHRR